MGTVIEPAVDVVEVHDDPIFRGAGTGSPAAPESAAADKPATLELPPELRWMRGEGGAAGAPGHVAVEDGGTWTGPVAASGAASPPAAPVVGAVPAGGGVPTTLPAAGVTPGGGGAPGTRPARAR